MFWNAYDQVTPDVYRNLLPGFIAFVTGTFAQNLRFFQRLGVLS